MDQKETKTPKRQITIAGKNGAGKSTVNKLLCEAFPDYDSYSAGDFFRSIGVEKGLTLEQVGAEAKEDLTIDEMVDAKTRSLRDQEGFILDSRIGFYFLPDAFTVFLDCPEDIAAARIVKNAHQEKGRAGQTVGTLEEEIEKIQVRHRVDSERYRELYGIENNFDHKHFDLVIDTSVITPEEVRDQIIEAYEKHLGKKS